MRKFCKLSASAFMLVAAILLPAVKMQARVLSPDEALARAAQQLSTSDNSRKMVRALAAGASQCVFTGEATLSTGSVPAYYVFNTTDNAFIITGADDAMFPVLAVSDEGAFDPANIPPQMKWWLGEYARQLEYYISVSSKRIKLMPSARGESAHTAPVAQPLAEGTAPRRTTRTAIPAMVQTKWDQGSPYNNDCPTSNGQRCYTGCVATAMAQVMKYHEWPDKGNGSHTYEWDNTNLSFDFGSTTFDWANMKNSYGNVASNASKAAVASLMYACGVSVDMYYGTQSSGAQSSAIGNAMKNYFRYGDKTVFYGRIGVNASNWDALVYAALEQGYPVLYSGTGELGGHEFVCDGYRADGLFHINWGWSGSSDGYFALNALDPTDLGTGGGSGGFNFGQDIVIACPPDKPGFIAPDNVVPAQLYTDKYSKTADNSTGITLDFSIRNNSDQKIDFVLGPRLVDDELEYVWGCKGNDNYWNLSLQPGTYYPEVSLELGISTINSLADGTYYFYAAYRDPSNTVWKPLAVETGPTACKLVKAGGKTTVSLDYFPDSDPGQDPEPEKTYIIEFTGLTPVMAVKNINSKYTVKYRNTGDGDFNGPLYLALCTVEGNTLQCWDFCTISTNAEIAAGTDYNNTIDYTCIADPGDYIMVLCTEEGEYLKLLDVNNFYDFTVKSYTASLSAGELPAAEAGGTMTVADGTFKLTYTNASDFSFLPEIEVTDAKGNSIYTGQLEGVILHGSDNSTNVADLPGFEITVPEKAGTYTLSYTAGTLDCEPVTATFKVNANEPEPVKLTAIELTISNSELRAGETALITITPVPADAAVDSFTLTSLSESLEVNEYGEVTVADYPALGEAKVKVSGDGTDVSAEIAINIIATPVESIVINPSETKVTAPASVTLDAEVLPALATDKTVKWSVEYPDATINDSGILTIGEQAPAGKLTVTAEAADGSGITATAEINVEAMEGVYSVSGDGLKVIVTGGTVKVSAPAGTTVSLYDTAGRLIFMTSSIGNDIEFAPSASGVYILRTADKTMRIVL